MHISASVLPPALLDLTLLRVSARSNVLSTGFASVHTKYLPKGATTRAMHQAALATAPIPSPYQYQDAISGRHPQAFGRTKRRSRGQGSLAIRSGAITPPASELQRRVQALQAAGAAEESVVEIPTYSEEDLLSLYEDLLALPPTSTYQENSDSGERLLAQAEQDLSIINAVDQRLLERGPEPLDEKEPSSLLTTLRQRRTQIPQYHEAQTNESWDSEMPFSGTSTQPYRRVLWRVQEIVSRMEGTRSFLVPSVGLSEAALPKEKAIPVMVLSKNEYESLTRVCIQARDGEAAEFALNLMKRSGLSPSENSVTDVLELYANDGNVAKAERLLTNFLSGPPTERQRHLHIKAHLKSTPFNTIPTSALAVLHNYESQSVPAPMPTYTRLITTLFSTPSSIARAQAWDLFTHMRYVAHPLPDTLLYTLMIRACASSLTSRPSEPERALDLWTEMTVDHRISPTVGTYSAVILACARSGEKMYVNEAFRLAKEMLDAHRDARGLSAFRPDRRTFCALLEGAKRIGDLARARWILAEMVRGSGREAGADGNGALGAEVTEEVMMHVFHAYAAYKPPFTRTTALLLKDKTGSSHPQYSQPPLSPGSEGESPASFLDIKSLPVEDTQPTFTHIPPQNRSEVIAEVKALFNRILEDTGADTQETHYDTVFSADRTFKDVQITPRLLNSYISVHYRHSSLEVSRELYKKVFEELGVHRNARSYVEALERCAMSRKGRERMLALEFAEEVWNGWLCLENSEGGGEKHGSMVPGRLVERAHVAMIRMLTLSGNVDRALIHVRSFVEHYPAASIRQLTPKPALRATRTVLVGARPLVRMTSTVEVPDDTVPALLTFGDLEVLHHRLAAAGKHQEVGYLKYVCKAYEGALRARRDGTMKAEPLRADSDPLVVD